MTFLLYVSLLTLLVTASAKIREERVSQSSCNKEYRVASGETIEFIYDGAIIPDLCILHLQEDVLLGKNICMGITQKGDLCPGITVEYHWNVYRAVPHKVIDCTTSDTDVYEEFCRKSSTFELALVDRSDFNWTTPLKMKLYLKEAEVAETGNYREVRVSESYCDKQYRVSLGVPIEFIYDGAYIPDPCKLHLREDVLYGKDICMGITQKGDLCPGITVEYHWHYYRAVPHKVIDCTTSDTDVYEEFCRKSSTFDLALVDRSDFNWTTPLKIRLYINDTEVADDRNVSPPMANTNVYTIIGIVVGCIVILVILVVVVVVYCCRRRQYNTGSAAYRSPQMASATTTTQASTEMSPMETPNK